MKLNKNVTRLPGMLTVLALALAGFGQAQAAGVTDQDILNDATVTHQIVTQWSGHQGTALQSPLNQVNVDTVKNLVPQCGPFRLAAKSSAASSRSR
jgi:alcohol dehydrogenase (cytochrome c)